VFALIFWQDWSLDLDFGYNRLHCSHKGSEELLEDHKAGRQLSQLLFFCGPIEAYGQGRSEPVMGLSEGISQQQLYDTCGVHHVTTKDKEISMLVEKDYPLRKGLAIGMISYKLQVENYSQMANDLILKIYKIANYPSQQGRIVGNKMHKAFPLPVIEFPLAEEVPTASEESYHYQKKRDATAKRIAQLGKCPMITPRF
nr:hypothetical protein [Tanacetum cinerariifolium]